MTESEIIQFGLEEYSQTYYHGEEFETTNVDENPKESEVLLGGIKSQAESLGATISEDAKSGSNVILAYGGGFKSWYNTAINVALDRTAATSFFLSARNSLQKWAENNPGRTVTVKRGDVTIKFEGVEDYAEVSRFLSGEFSAIPPSKQASIYYVFVGDHGTIGSIGDDGRVILPRSISDVNATIEDQLISELKENDMTSDSPKPENDKASAPDQSVGKFIVTVHGGSVGAIGDWATVTMNIGRISADEETKKELQQDVAKLRDELQKAKPENAEEAAAIGDITDQALTSVAKEQPNKRTVQVTAKSLIEAAKNIGEALPYVLPIATKIATTIMKIAGVPVPV